MRIMKKKEKGLRFRAIDRLMITLIVLLGIFVPISIVFSQATFSKSNIEVEQLKSKVDKQTRSNQSLSMQVDELASLSNIQGIAKEYGLSYNNDNIIVIDD